MTPPTRACLLQSLFLLLAIPALASSPAAAKGIDWQLVNPFRFFADAKQFALHREAFLATKGSQDGKSHVLEIERHLSRQHPQGWSKSTFTATCWHLISHRHEACGGLDSYINPQRHRISAKLAKGIRSNADCEWRFRKADGNGETPEPVVVPCNKAVTIEVPYPGGGTLTVRSKSRRLGRQTIKVRDVLVVGVGDSFASADGNPDVPVVWHDEETTSYGKLPGGVKLENYPKRRKSTIEYEGRSVTLPSAYWSSQPCHRSLYSHQLRVALQLALEDPQRAITFLGYSCSGAEITNGLLLRYNGGEYAPVGPNRAQLGDVAAAQCGAQDHEMRNYPTTYTARGAVPELENLFLERCPRDKARKIDLLLLSIGGNDIGFANLLAHAILPDGGLLTKLGRLTGTILLPAQARSLFQTLEQRYRMLRRAIHNHLHISWKEPDRVVLTAYPVIGLIDDGETPCPTSTTGVEVFPLYELGAPRIRAAESVAADLGGLMKRTARRYGWSFVDGHVKRFAGRGICAGRIDADPGDPDELRFPLRVNGDWVPYRPSLFRSYASRQRWMRTPNDAFMTANLHLFADIKGVIFPFAKNDPSNLLQASSYSGAFHPTAEGQAAMADAVLPAARRILKKYGR